MEGAKGLPLPYEKFASASERKSCQWNLTFPPCKGYCKDLHIFLRITLETVRGVSLGLLFGNSILSTASVHSAAMTLGNK